MNTWLAVICIVFVILLGAYLVNRKMFEPKTLSEVTGDKHIHLTLTMGKVDRRPFIILEWREPQTPQLHTQWYTIYRVEQDEIRFLQLANTRNLTYKDFAVQTGKTYSYFVIRSTPLYNPESLPSPIESITI